MMEASELMIGDLVRVNKDVCFKKGTIVRVHAIDGDRNFPEKRRIGCVTCVPIDDPDGCSGGVWTAFLDPIPLTAEILEKNGWGKDTYSNESYDNEDIECLSLWVGEDVKNKWWWHAGCELVTPINYVHQLQHALKLCRIEKEITV